MLSHDPGVKNSKDKKQQPVCTFRVCKSYVCTCKFELIKNIDMTRSEEPKREDLHEKSIQVKVVSEREGYIQCIALRRENPILLSLVSTKKKKTRKKLMGEKKRFGSKGRRKLVVALSC